MVVSAVERFAQVIPLNIQEIFLWYFEQKGVDNPERFLNIQSQQPESNQNLNALLPIIGILAGVNKGAGVNDEAGINDKAGVNNKDSKEPQKKPNEFDEFIDNVEKLSKQEVKNEV